VFLVVYRERLKLLRWRRRRWRKKIRDVEDKWEEDEKFRTKENQIDEERVIFLQLWMLLGMKEIHWKLINFQLLVSLYFVYVSKGEVGEYCRYRISNSGKIKRLRFYHIKSNQRSI
jgi:hypothetical protein